MRDFEEDFEFDFEEGVRVIPVKGARIDSHRRVTFLPSRDDDSEHQARIDAHRERVQRELQELKIRKVDKE